LKTLSLSSFSLLFFFFWFLLFQAAILKARPGLFFCFPDFPFFLFRFPPPQGFLFSVLRELPFPFPPPLKKAFSFPVSQMKASFFSPFGPGPPPFCYPPTVFHTTGQDLFSCRLPLWTTRHNYSPPPVPLRFPQVPFFIPTPFFSQFEWATQLSFGMAPPPPPPLFAESFFFLLLSWHRRDQSSRSSSKFFFFLCGFPFSFRPARLKKLLPVASNLLLGFFLFLRQASLWIFSRDPPLPLVSFFSLFPPPGKTFLSPP